ncbi:hypothetical protein Leryth_026690, partial [Lithospermum erythrorhizon]
VTGANKGIGFGICKQLISNGITVVLTARNEKRGVEAMQKLKECGITNDLVVFHQLDVVDPSSVSSLAEFIETSFGRLDILVNNAGVGGVTHNGTKSQSTHNDLIETYDLAVECLQTNYYGVKRMVETFVPLLKLSDSPRVVNVSSSMGGLKNIPNEWAKRVLNDAENLTEEKIDEILNTLLKDYKDGSHKDQGWPAFMPAYIVSKAALNAYSRILAKRNPTLKINCVCPGFVKTDINYNQGILSVDEGAEGPVRLCLLPDDGPSGLFFVRKDVGSFE